MKRNLLSLSILLMCAAFAYGGSLQGTVRDVLTRNPIEGVNVTVHVLSPDSIPFPTTTDHDGRYSISEIVPNNKIYVVVTHMTGYAMSYTRIDNLGSLDLSYDIFLTGEGIIPPGGLDSSTVIGTIMTPTAGTGPLLPVANAQVRLSSLNEQFDILTNTEGKYSTSIPQGIYFVTISAEGYNNLTISGVQAQQNGATVDAILQQASVGIVAELDRSQPIRFILYDAYPNPFNPTTTIKFSIGKYSYVSLRVYDILGREKATIFSGSLVAGSYSKLWDASSFPSGIYFYRLQSDNFAEMKKLVLLK